MRKKNSISDFTSERNMLLITRFREMIARQSSASVSNLFKDVANSPSPRFWVSEERAAEVISKMMKGEKLPGRMYAGKKEMYLEIYRRVKRLKEKDPQARLSHLVFRVVNQEAPSFYLSWERVYQLVQSNRKKSM